MAAHFRLHEYAVTGTRVLYRHCHAAFIALHLNHGMYATIGLIVGTWWHAFIMSSIGIFAMGLCTVISMYTRFTRLALLLLFMGVGAGNYTYRYYHWHELHQRYAERTWNVVGAVQAHDEVSGAWYRRCLVIRCHQIQDAVCREHGSVEQGSTERGSKGQGPWQPCTMTLAITVPYSPPVHIGDVILLNALTLHDTQPLNDRRIHRGIHFCKNLPHLNYQLVHRPVWSLSRWFDQVRQDLYARCLRKLTQPARDLFAGIFLGKASTRYNQMRELWGRWGLVHMLARSGLHLMILFMVLGLCTSFIPLPYVVKHAYMVGVVMLYTVLSWPSISYARALLTILFYKVGTLSDTPVHSLHLLSVITTLIVLYQPTYVFALDFQLSFGLTGALLWINALRLARKRELASKPLFIPPSLP